MDKYKVRFYQDDIYEVWLIDESDDDDSQDISVFQGTLTDCEAWIRLKEGGYL